jgi:hypothetical protein
MRGDGENGRTRRFPFYSVLANVVPQDFSFPLIGLVNVSRGMQHFPQLGAVNVNVGSFKSAQLGIINVAAGDVTGVQAGFINRAGTLRGVQIGFLNFVDNAEHGIPIGVFSIVRHGGYHAIELSFNEVIPINQSLLLGVPHFYTIFQIGYDPSVAKYPMSASTFGLGFGSIFSIGETGFFINIEYRHYSEPGFLVTWTPNTGLSPDGLARNAIASDQSVTSFPILAGYRLNRFVSFVAGPELTFLTTFKYAHNDKPVFRLGWKLSEDRFFSKWLLIGVLVGVRTTF